MTSKKKSQNPAPPQTEDYLTASSVGVRQSERFNITSGMTPDRLVDILDRAANGDTPDFAQLSTEIEEKDAQIASKLQTRRLALQGSDYVVLPGDDSARATEIADLFRSDVADKPVFHDAVGALLEGLATGFGIIQPVYDTTAAIWSPVRYATPDLRWFRFNSQDLYELRLVDDYQPDGLPVPPDTFICHYPKNRPGPPCRVGLARLCSISWMLKALATKDYAGFIEAYGVPLRIGRYNPGSVNDEVIDQFRRTLAELGSDAAALVPKGVLELEVLDGRGAVGSNSGAGGPHDSFVRWLDEQVSKAIHGQTLTSDSGGSLAQGKVHADVAQLYLDADGKSMSATITGQLCRRWTDLNFGRDAPSPVFKFLTTPPEDLQAWTDVAASWVDRGVRMKESDILEKLKLDPVDDTDPVIQGGASPTEDQEPMRLSLNAADA